MFNNWLVILSVTVVPADEAQTVWAWAIRREPDQMLMVRSRPKYATHDQALEAAHIAAKNVSRKLSIPFAIGAPGANAD